MPLSLPRGQYRAGMSEERIPIADVLPGMSLHPLPPGWTPVESFVIVKGLDEAGRASWCYRTSSAPNREELLGALRVQMKVLERELVDEFSSEDDE